MPVLIIVGIVAVVAVIVCVYKIYSWYDEANNAEEKRKELFKKIDEANSEVSKLRNKIFEKDNIINSQKDKIDSLKLKEKISRDLVDLYKSKIKEISQEKAVKMANDMASQHNLIRYYSEADINAFSKYFDSELVDRYFNAIRDYKLVRAFEQDIRMVSAKIDVEAEITSAKDKNQIYEVTLKSCSCPANKKPCKHMLFLAMQIGVLPYRKDIIGIEYKKIADKREELNEREAALEKAEKNLSRRMASFEKKKEKLKNKKTEKQKA